MARAGSPAERVNDGVVYQSGKGRATNRGGPGRQQAHRWPVGSARDLPRPAPRQRAGPAYEVSFAGRSTVFRRRRFGPALLREAPRCSCPAVACGDRGVSDSTWAAGLLFGADGVAVTVSPDRTGRGCLPGHRHCLKRHDSLGFDQGLLLRPLVPRECSRGLARPPPAVSDAPVARERAHGASSSIRPRRPSIERHGASVPTRVHLPPQLHHTRVSCDRGSAPGRRHPRAMSAAPAPDFHRPAGLTSLSGWLPTTPPQGGSNMGATIAPAPKRHQKFPLITLAAAALQADLAPRHYRIAAPGDMLRKSTSAASGHRSGSDGALRLSRPPEEHHHGADHRLVGAGHLHAGPAGVRRLQDAPAALDGHQPHQCALPGPPAHTTTMRPWAADSSGSTDAETRADASGASASSPTRSTNVSGPNTATGRCRSPLGGRPATSAPWRSAAPRGWPVPTLTHSVSPRRRSADRARPRRYASLEHVQAEAQFRRQPPDGQHEMPVERRYPFCLSLHRPALSRTRDSQFDSDARPTLLGFAASDGRQCRMPVVKTRQSSRTTPPAPAPCA